MGRLNLRIQPTQDFYYTSQIQFPKNSQYFLEEKSNECNIKRTIPRIISKLLNKPEKLKNICALADFLLL